MVLSDTQQLLLHTSLHTAYLAAPAESGAAELELSATAAHPDLEDLRQRAELLGMSPSE